MFERRDCLKGLAVLVRGTNIQLYSYTVKKNKVLLYTHTYYLYYIYLFIYLYINKLSNII